MAKNNSYIASGQLKGKANKNADKQHEPDGKYSVLISKRFVVLSLLSCVLAAFAVGRTARMLLLVNPQKQLLQMSRAAMAMAEANHKDNDTMTKEESSSLYLPMKTLPDPKMRDGKYPPETIYTSKTFGTGSTGSSQSRWIVTDAGREQCVDLPDHECPKTPPNNNNEHIDNNVNGTGEVHLPAGQHLLLDIENVDGSFLNSEERLAHAMLELVGECGLTLLSYHCHKMVPMGVSCAGVLLESHVSFHTWPKEGVITLDLYTCGPNSLLPIVPLATRLFAIPREGVGEDNSEQPNVVWAHKTRGYPQGDEESLEAEMTDMEYFPVGKMTDYKNEVSKLLLYLLFCAVRLCAPFICIRSHCIASHRAEYTIQYHLTDFFFILLHVLLLTTAMVI
jgi:S-adenosylmethionine decarboxylase proenzyme